MDNTATAPVEYFKIPNAPGEYFRCPRYHGNATLSVTACAAQFNRTRTGGEDARIRLHACVNCPIGAQHAGIENFKPKTALQTSKLCTRCHRPASRIIHGRLCVSCVNRQYEIQKGKNARGNKPSQCPALHPLHVTVRDGDRPAQDREYLATGILEAALSALKTARDHAVVGFRGPPPRPANEQLTMF
ncbi:MAG TPA: hypothetical protein VFX91_12195 [Alcanivorax sp.]|nr:hypothetical protein [Alcanivorax sp.]